MRKQLEPGVPIALDLSECPDYEYEPLSTAGKMGRSRHPCADHRICQFCGGTGSGIPERRTGYSELVAKYLP